MTSNQQPSIALTLPGELLIAICLVLLQPIKTRAQHCRLDLVDDPDVNQTQHSIMAVSQVCRAWRNIVTRSPELWCHFLNPYHRTPQWTQLVFERSKPHGITFHKLPPIFLAQEHRLAIMNELAYIERLTSYSVALQLDCRVWYMKAASLCCSQLEYLCICHFLYPEEEFFFQPQFHQGLVLPPDFPSNTSTPKLKRLHLHGCSLGYISQITQLNNLEELRISGVLVWTMTQWVEILQSLHRLKRLALDSAVAEPGRKFILGIRVDDEDPNFIAQIDSDPNPILALDLEEFVLRDGYRVVAQFFDKVTFTVSRLFQLVCLNDTAREGEYLSFISRRITPIIHNLLETNPQFANCSLRVSDDTMMCQGVQPDHPDWSEVSQPKRVGEGRSFFEGTFIAVNPENYSCEEYIKEWLYPAFSNVMHFNCMDDEGVMFKEDRWLSELLRKSSHRLKALHGITPPVWPIILRNMFPERYEFEPPCLPDISFLSELDELGFYMDDLPEDYPLYQTILDFCRRKTEMGRPLVRCRDPPPFSEAGPGRVAFIKDLEALGIQVIDED